MLVVVATTVEAAVRVAAVIAVGVVVLIFRIHNSCNSGIVALVVDRIVVPGLRK